MLCCLVGWVLMFLVRTIIPILNHNCMCDLTAVMVINQDVAGNTNTTEITMNTFLIGDY